VRNFNQYLDQIILSENLDLSREKIKAARNDIIAIDTGTKQKPGPFFLYSIADPDRPKIIRKFDDEDSFKEGIKTYGRDYIKQHVIVIRLDNDEKEIEPDDIKIVDPGEEKTKSEIKI
jgi:hypothetical protein